MIAISIDVTLLDKSRIKEVTRRNGKAAKFLELILFETPNGEHGDYIVKQSITKDERDARKEMPILGNGKILGGSSPARPKSAPAKTADAEKKEGDDVPF